ncbi:PLP-dependent aminotransferase family protein [Propioniciclava coleopterorum]|uniref:PLP-dependent aminotransferase family protein n=2 Tax=Propioniciclava coleopterorum TaxID=2714937 RepID=A0A6G7Y5Z7_9ACTN|nr:PLP-dependent aminotransferase family protein [Propioniciclava coleopterorum]
MSSLEPSHRDTRMDPYIDQYADRTGSMTVSAVRALFSVANRPEVVSLAGGMPNITDLPLGRLGDSFDKLVQTKGVQAMQYGSGQGEPFMREKVVDVMAEEQIRANSDDVVITCGSQQALDLVTRIFINPGDVVLCEAPSYVGALGTFNAYQAEIHHVAMDEHGLVPSAVKEAVTTLRAAGKRVKFLYTIPNFNNPTGIQQPLERRRELLAVAHELDLLVVEDNPYGLLTIEGEPLPALRSMDPDVIYLGSFSKTFAPGFRIGWVLAPHAVRERLVIAQEAAVLSPPVFSQFAITDYLDNFDWRGQIVAFRDMYRARRDAMLQGLSDHMPAAATWTRPTGGFFVWLTLPEGLDSQALLARAVSERVAYVPGNAFYADGFGSRNMRLSYCFPTPERIYEGTRRLGKVIRDELEMRATFGLPATEVPHTQVGGPAPDLS